MKTIAAVMGIASALSACATGPVEDDLEEIYVLRSIREAHAPMDQWCSADKTGFAPFPADAERLFSFWSVQTRPDDGRVIDAHHQRVAGLRACFGATGDGARQNFYAEITLGALAFHGGGECLAIRTDFPERGLFSVRCHLVLHDLPAAYAGGLLTTNTLTSQAAFGGASTPAGYTQASVATIRLWRARVLADSAGQDRGVAR